jgi:hypothetical protein
MTKLLLAAGCLALLCGGCYSGGGGRGLLRGSGRYCPPWDDFCVKETAHRHASKSFAQYCQQAGQSFSVDFRDGFKQAYCDLACGGNGVTPAIPPPRYWNARYRTASGHARAQQWFEGYAAGTIQAESEGVKTFNTIPLSPGMTTAPDWGPVPPQW